MESSDERGDRKDGGGITGLARAVLEHREAIEYDLLTKTGHKFDDIGRDLPWAALDSFIKCIGPDSAIMRELYPEQAEWGTVAKTNKILADIFDVLAQINANVVALAEKKPAKTPGKYPRPDKKEPDEKKHFGKGALPPAQLREWFENKRRQKCQR